MTRFVELEVVTSAGGRRTTVWVNSDLVRNVSSVDDPARALIEWSDAEACLVAGSPADVAAKLAGMPTAEERESAQRAQTEQMEAVQRGFYGRGVYTMGYSGDAYMKKMADETGGRVIDVGNNGKKLEEAFAQIQDESPQQRDHLARLYQA